MKRKVGKPKRKIGARPRIFTPAVPTCIGCGCTDEEGCFEGCSWIRQDAKNFGVCSMCPDDVKRFDSGNREMHTQ